MRRSARRFVMQNGVAIPTDPNFANVSLLFHHDGADASTTIVDSSSYGHTFTCGGSAQLDTAQAKFGASSLWMNGADTLIGPTAHSAFDFGSGDFTIEGFIKRGSTGVLKVWATNRSPSGSDYGWIFYESGASGSLSFTAFNPAGTVVVNMSSASTMFGNTNWIYVGVKRSGSSFTIWHEGTQVASATYSGAIVNSVNPIVMGYDPSTAGRDFIGHMDEWRITKGVARDLSVIPTAPFPNS